MRRQATNWEEIFAEDISDKGLLSKIHKELNNKDKGLLSKIHKKLNNKKSNNLVKKWAKYLSRYIT